MVDAAEDLEARTGFVDGVDLPGSAHGDHPDSPVSEPLPGPDPAPAAVGAAEQAAELEAGEESPRAGIDSHDDPAVAGTEGGEARAGRRGAGGRETLGCDEAGQDERAEGRTTHEIDLLRGQCADVTNCIREVRAARTRRRTRFDPGLFELLTGLGKICSLKRLESL